MKKIKNFVLALLAGAVLICGLAMPVSASGTDCPGSMDPAECAKRGVGKIGKSTSPDIMATIKTILTSVFFVSGVIAVIVIILGGISYMTSQGDAGKVKKGKDTILYGIVGLIIVLMAQVIVTFVLNAF